MKLHTMNTNQKYLTYVTTKLKERIRELQADIEDGMEDVSRMHEYYWDNYTEMDQYGYEDYDNQQALLGQLQTNRQRIEAKRRLERMLDSPYFGRVDFCYDGEEAADAFYIGIGNFSELNGSVPLIYDWRAPVSSLFYDYDKGPAAYEAPSGILEGTIFSKWQYKIRGGKELYGFESDMKIDDDILKQELGLGGDVKLKNIVRTIQKEQNRIIRNIKDKIMVVQGAAGSGKTSVALHRIAYLLYHERKNLKSSNILILSPNSVFSDYISHILPELGEENIKEMSFDIFAYQELKDFVADCEDKYDLLERQIQKNNNREMERYRMKQSAWMIGEIEGFLLESEENLVNLQEIEFRGMRLEEQKISSLFYDKFAEVPILKRLEMIRDYFIDEYETFTSKTLAEADYEYLDEKFRRMYVTTDCYEIYNMLLQKLDFPLMPDVPPEKRYLDYEDVYPMIYLKYRLLGKQYQKLVKHVVIDEMQDYSYLQYVILQKLFSCKMTILGDKGQTMDEMHQDVMTFLPKIFGRDIHFIEMNKSYRNTVEIASYACRISGIDGLELLQRHGKAVEELRFEDENEFLNAVLGRLRDETFETTAILTRTDAEAQKINDWMKRAELPVHYIHRNSCAFEKGITITTYYLAKGLEFDRVFAVRGNCNTNLEKQADYICATRALHELYMCELSHPMLRE